MKSFIWITAFLLCSFSWVSVSVSESQTVEVQPGDEVTLQCSNISRSPTHTFWSRLVNKTNISCISSMYGSDSDVQFCTGFQNGKFKMSSNNSTVFLKITQVDLSDSGLYLCGFYLDGHTKLKGIHLNVHGQDEFTDDMDIECKKESDENTKLTSVILGGLAVFLLMVIIGLVVKITTLQTAPNEEHNTPHNENLGSDNMNYAALSFNPKPKRNRRPVSGREVEPNVIYAATK
ncbi:uncharacterized protein LOC121889877 [Scomber scombrus]|uniref:Uncharacterized protein LOC121889877 n=1 Tax=Scomber scombrus TaxID=13677 RepID=A0AAV1P0U2_SCOSC